MNGNKRNIIQISKFISKLLKEKNVFGHILFKDTRFESLYLQSTCNSCVLKNLHVKEFDVVAYPNWIMT